MPGVLKSGTASVVSKFLHRMIACLLLLGNCKILTSLSECSGLRWVQNILRSMGHKRSGYAMGEYMKRFGFAVTLALVSVALVSCDMFDSSQSSNEILLAAMYNLTGDQSSLDVPSSQGAQLAVNERNDSGGLLGRQVRLLIRDGQTDPARVSTITRDLIS